MAILPTLLMLQVLPLVPRLNLLPAARACRLADETADVVVCARDTSRHRLPLPVERDIAQRDGPIRGEAPGASLDQRPCGLFAGQRDCGKAEAARYGYGGGRDPLTVGTKLLRKLFDPDAELGEPTPVPPPRP